MSETTETRETSNTSETTETTETTVISLLNQKGGVGKTTLSIHLGGALAARGHEVLLIDLAPEGASTAVLGFEDHYTDNSADITLHEVLADFDSHEQVNELIQSGEEFDLLPAHERMVDNTVPALEGEPRARERLQLVIDEIERSYDYVLVDCAPSIDVLTDNALRNASGVLIPSYPEKLNLQGLDRLQKQIASIEQYYSPVNVIGLVANRIEHNNQSKEILEKFHEYFGEKMPIFEIYKRVALQRSIAQHRQSIFGVAESSDMEDELVAIATHIEETVGTVEATA